MNEQELINLQQIAGNFIGSYGWLFIATALLAIFKQTIENFVSSIMIFLGNDYNIDDIVIIDGKICRIVRQNIWKTVFFVYTIRDHHIIRETKWVVQNTKLEDIKIEKPLADLRIEQLFYNTNGNGKS